MLFLFWFSIVIVLFTYLFFPAILFVLSLFKRDRVNKSDIFPSVSIIVAAHNEAKVIRGRIENLLELDYPKEKLEIIIASDGSGDGMNRLVEGYSHKDVVLVKSDGRQGKSRVQNLAALKAKGDIMVFSDAGTVFEADFLKKLVRNFADKRVGCVTSRLIYKNFKDSSISRYAGGFYWRYELLLKRLESRLGVLFATSGQCMAVRKDIFAPITRDGADDDVVPLDCLLKGYRVIYEPEAVAYDEIISSANGELKSRIRMTIRAITGILLKRELINPFRHFWVALTIISHKILRYLAPFFMITALFANIFLLDLSPYTYIFVAQLIFYSLAIVGYFLEVKGWQKRVFAIPFCFCIANLGFMLGVVKALSGERIVAYETRLEIGKC
jgi:cellulose synthase/poly-beta-1,6-N-acetylglucosamine synthase-like glycosyltransferase